MAQSPVVEAAGVEVGQAARRVIGVGRASPHVGVQKADGELGSLPSKQGSQILGHPLLGIGNALDAAEQVPFSVKLDFLPGGGENLDGVEQAQGPWRAGERIMIAVDDEGAYSGLVEAAELAAQLQSRPHRSVPILEKVSSEEEKFRSLAQTKVDDPPQRREGRVLENALEGARGTNAQRAVQVQVRGVDELKVHRVLEDRTRQ